MNALVILFAPVVHEHEAEDAVFGVSHGDRLAEDRRRTA
jgi:hypothetical protein